jgi:hypothetical protein
MMALIAQDRPLDGIAEENPDSLHVGLANQIWARAKDWPLEGVVEDSESWDSLPAR